jgi:perosamine synthetase
VTQEVVPVSAPSLGRLEQEYVADAVQSSWVGPVGKYIDRFRSEFAQACEVSHAIPVSNGTVALHLALAGLGVGPGDEVIVPSLTYVATANAVTYCGATPVFADVEADSWGLDPAAVRHALSSRTRAIIAVHLYGMPASMRELAAIAQDAGVALVEDSAEAPFARFEGAATGGLGDVATFSFYGNKIVTCGEGGAVTTNDPELAARLELLRGQGMDPQRRYWFPVVGYNYRLTNVAAAMLCAQLERREHLVSERWRCYRAYDCAISGVEGLSAQRDLPGRVRSPWLYPLLVDEAYGESADELADRLARAGVETRPFFIPVHTLPPYLELARAQRSRLPVTDRLAAQGLSLPTFPDLADDQLERIGRLLQSRP